MNRFPLAALKLGDGRVMNRNIYACTMSVRSDRCEDIADAGCDAVTTAPARLATSANP
jgi:hypothetical protein